MKMYDTITDVYYFTYDEYDLNKKIIGNDLIIGMKLTKNKDKITSCVLYEDDDGNKMGFDMRNKRVKKFWDSNIGLPLFFESF